MGDDVDEKADAEEELARLKQKINHKVEDGRNRIKKLLANMKRKAAERKKNMLDSLQNLRSKLAKEVFLANKNGDYQKCLKGQKDLEFRENYCNTNFVEDYIHNSTCKDEADYCYTCCENEYGNSFRAKRNMCYKECDGKKVSITI